MINNKKKISTLLLLAKIFFLDPCPENSISKNEELKNNLEKDNNNEKEIILKKKK